MRTALLLALAANLVAAGCGGSGGDPKTYRADLDAQCKRTFDFNKQLPQVQKDRKLDTGEIAEMAEDEGQRFVAAVRDLDPPSDLGDAHDELVSTLENPPDADSDIDKVLPYFEKVNRAYRGVKAKRCTSLSRENISMIEQSVENKP